MALVLSEHWTWDFWFAREEDGTVHVFYLQAPRALGDPELRHRNATIGHAVSRDLRAWEVLPDALGPGPPGEFDDLATWTGSVLRHDARWVLFYTGISRAEDGAVQRVGWAVSDDLVHWERRGVLLEADPRYYEVDPAREVFWRDPWVERDEESGRFHMLVTARANHGPPELRGVIAHAWSRDLRSWEVGPPVSAPGHYSMLEVPQLVRLGGAWRIIFCTEHPPQWGTHYVTSEAKFGPYAPDRDEFLIDGHYAGRVLAHEGEPLLFTWPLRDERGAFAGGLSDPLPITVAPDGSLEVGRP